MEGVERPWPSISIVMPVRNEAKFIRLSAGAMLQQDYEGEIEVLVVDGMSEDGTPDIVIEMANEDPRIRLLHNPHKIVPSSMNIGIREAKNEYIARMDGHTIADRDYLQKCVSVLRSTGADCVGGTWRYSGNTYISRVIAATMDSKFGVGTSRWRGSSKPGPSDTVPYGFFTKAKALDIGGFDERLVRNQDYEFLLRLRDNGGLVYYSPEISSTYFVRSSLKRLIKQYFQYGLWKAKTVHENPRAMQLRHLLPPLLVLGILLGPLLGLIHNFFWTIYFSAILIYLCLTVVFALKQAIKHGLILFPLLPIVFVILHFTWGTGFLISFLKIYTPE